MVSKTNASSRGVLTGQRLCLAWEVLRLQSMDQKYYRSRGIVRHLDDTTRFVNPGVYRVLDDYPRRADGETPQLNEVVVEDDNQDVFYGTLMTKDEAHSLVANQQEKQMPRTETETKMVFPKGMFIHEPHPNAPEFIKARVSIKREDFIAWLEARDEEWLRFDIKESLAGKWYCSLDTFEPKSGGGDDSLPF